MVTLSRARTYGARLPMRIERAEGSWLWTGEGRRILDCLASAGAVSLGHNHPAVLAALEQVRARRLPTLALDFDTEPLADFLDELGRVVPAGLGSRPVVQLCPPSGTVAVEAAVTMAEFATGRSGVVSFEGGFHGCTRLSRSASTAGELALHPLTSVAGAVVLPYPDVDVGCDGVAQPQADESTVATLRRVLGLTTPQRRPPAAAIVECVQGEAGGLAASAPFLQALRAACTEAGVVLIADEIQAGVGRTGTMWSFEPAGICPDVIVTSKGLGGGVPVAAVVARSDVDRWPAGAFTGTFRGSTDGYAAAAATLRTIRETGLVATVRERGDRFRAALEVASTGADAVDRICGRGLLLGAKLGERPLGAGAELARAIQATMFELGVLVEIGGRSADVVRFLPPLTATDDELTLAAETFALALDRTGARKLVAS